MGSQGPKSLSKPPSRTNSRSHPPQPSPSTPSSTLPSTSTTTSQSPSLSTHLAMVELKQKILTSLSKLSDRDTHQIGLEELETLIQSLQNDAVPMLLNSLFDSSSSDPKPSVKKDSIRLLGTLCGAHPDSTGTHLTKIIAHLAKRLRDSDSGVRDACKDVIGCLSSIYLNSNSVSVSVSGNWNGGPGGGVVGMFVKPLFEAMGENNKGVQVGAAMCLGRVVDCAHHGSGKSKEGPNSSSGFGKLGVRVCKFLNSPNFFAKSALLPVVASLSQVGAITPQCLEPLLQSIHECLASTDWATRKAAAEALIALALHSSDLVKDGATSTLTLLEGCRFDKIKPVRDSMTEALQLWKKLGGNGDDGALDDAKASSRGTEHEVPDKDNQRDKKCDQSKVDSLPRDSSNAADSVGKMKNGNFSDKAVGILKKKLSTLTEKDLNPEFFQKLDKRVTDDLPVEVVVPRKCLNASNSDGMEAEPSIAEVKDNTDKKILNRQRDLDGNLRDKLVDDGLNRKDLRSRTSGIDDRGTSLPSADNQSDGLLMNGKGNWPAIQRQLLQLERQQAHLMNMLQDFMGGSHDSMVTLESRVRGLERVVEDMAHDLSISSSRRGGGFRPGYEGSSNRPGRYNSFFDYGGRHAFGDRFTPADGVSSSIRGRGPSWRSEHQEPWDYHSYGASRNAQPSIRRDVSSNSVDGRSPRSEHDNDQVSARRGWDKGAGNVRLGEGPSARSVWQASKDEATLAAIRGAGEDNGTARAARVAVRELDAEAVGNDNNAPERDPIWTSWINAMDAVQVGDMDTAYAEVVSTGDDSLLVKLMDKSGPVFDQLSNEVAVEVLNAIMPFVVEQNLFDLSLSWMQQLLEVVLENGPDLFSIPIEVKRDLLFNLHDATSALEIPEDWEGPTPDQLMMQLASAWDIDLEQPGS